MTDADKLLLMYSQNSDRNAVDELFVEYLFPILPIILLIIIVVLMIVSGDMEISREVPHGETVKGACT